MEMRKAINTIAVMTLLTFLGGILLSGCGTKTVNKDTSQEKKTIRLTIGSALSPTTVAGIKIMDEFFVAEASKRVEERTNYRLEWKKVYGGTVAKPGEELQSVQNGLVDISSVVFGYQASQLPLQNFGYWVPFGSPDPTVTAKVVRQLYKDVPAMAGVFENQFNQKYLSFSVMQSYNLITKFPVQTVSALKGHKIAGVGPNLGYLTGTGAVPVQSALPEVYTSLQTGVYEGWINPIDSALSSKWYEVAPYFNVTDFGALPVAAITINLNTWKSLPKEVQDILVNVGDECIDVVAKDAKDKSEAQVAEWQKKGGKIVQLSPEERAKWADLLPNTPNEKAKAMDAKGLPGTTLVKQYFELLKQNGYTLPREYKID